MLEQKIIEVKLLDRRKTAICLAMSLAQHCSDNEQRLTYKRTISSMTASTKNDSRAVPEIDEYFKDYPTMLGIASAISDSIGPNWPFELSVTKKNT
jgi:hypothetical protein